MKHLIFCSIFLCFQIKAPNCDGGSPDPVSNPLPRFVPPGGNVREGSRLQAPFPRRLRRSRPLVYPSGPKAHRIPLRSWGSSLARNQTDFLSKQNQRRSMLIKFRNIGQSEGIKMRKLGFVQRRAEIALLYYSFFFLSNMCSTCIQQRFEHLFR